MAANTTTTKLTKMSKLYHAINDFYGWSARWKWLDEDNGYCKLIRALRKFDICTSAAVCREKNGAAFKGVRVTNAKQFNKFMMKYQSKYCEKVEVYMSEDELSLSES